MLKENFCKLVSGYDWGIFPIRLSVYREELRKFEKILESDNLGEISKDDLVIKIKALRFLVDLLDREFVRVCIE